MQCLHSPLFEPDDPAHIDYELVLYFIRLRRFP